MKKHLAQIGAALGLALLITGCESTGVDARIQEKSAVFATLTPEQRRYISVGAFAPGYTTDMVYMAVGKPSKIVVSADGRQTVWTYNNYYLPDAVAGMPAYLQQNNLANNASGQRMSGAREHGNATRNPTSLSSTTSGVPETGLSVPDIPTDTLYVTFQEGIVTNMELESQRK